MTKERSFKRRVRERMSKTGESYTSARSHVSEKRDRVQAARTRLVAADKPRVGQQGPGGDRENLGSVVLDPRPVGGSREQVPGDGPLPHRRAWCRGLVGAG